MSNEGGMPHRQFLHEVVSSALASRIASREFLPGDLLPGELVIADEFSVSRSVVRQALRTLQDRGIVQTSPGRGTVVAHSRAIEWHRNAQRLEGLSAQMRALGVRVSTNVVTLERIESTGRARAFGAGGCFLLERVRHVDGEPVAFIRTYLPVAVGEVLREEDLEDGSLHEEMVRRAAVDVRGGDRQIRAVAATGRIAQSLHLAVGEPVLLLEGSSVDQNSQVVEVFSTWHRSDRVALDLSAYGRQPAQNVNQFRELAAQARDLAEKIAQLEGGA